MDGYIPALICTPEYNHFSVSAIGVAFKYLASAYYFAWLAVSNICHYDLTI